MNYFSKQKEIIPAKLPVCIKINCSANLVSLLMSSAFQPPSWALHTNIYEVNMRQYTAEGTFRAFAAHLPRLKDMGVHTLWFMPITPISLKERQGTLGSYYACSSYTAINPEFGTAKDFKKLVSLAHEMGFKVIIDWVANHTGWDHEWTKQHPHWYKKESDGNFKRPAGMEDIIELDFTNPALRNAMVDAMKHWVQEFNIDGFRCDLAFWVDLSFWKEARKELEKIKPLFWLGEFDPLDSPAYTEVFDAAYTWAWMHKAEEFYKKNLSLKELLSVLYSYDAVTSANFSPVWFTTNHDENSWNGTEYEKYGDMAKLLSVFSCTWCGIPLIYSGQELPNKKRLKFFNKDQIDWDDKPALHDFYLKLLHVHSSNPALQAGDMETKPQVIKTDKEHHVLTFLRKKANHEVLVVLNFSEAEQTLNFIDSWIYGRFRNIFTEEIFHITGDSAILLKPWDYLVYEKCI
jgi:alpha-amylase